MDPYIAAFGSFSGGVVVYFLVALVFVLFLEPRPLGRLRRFFRLSAGAAVPAPVGRLAPCVGMCLRSHHVVRRFLDVLYCRCY